MSLEEIGRYGGRGRKEAEAILEGETQGRHEAEAALEEIAHARAMRLTTARRRGLEVLAKTRTAHRSNVTALHESQTVGRVGFVYWQIAEWMVDYGLATAKPGASQADGLLVLTDAGEKLAGEEGMEVASA
jgi:hypothetical protein